MLVGMMDSRTAKEPALATRRDIETVQRLIGVVEMPREGNAARGTETELLASYAAYVVARHDLQVCAERLQRSLRRHREIASATE